MSNIRLFYNKSLSLNLTATLNKSQSHYVSKVMRVKENEVFSLRDFKTSGTSLNDERFLYKFNNSFLIEESIL